MPPTASPAAANSVPLVNSSPRTLVQARVSELEPMGHLSVAMSSQPRYSNRVTSIAGSNPTVDRAVALQEHTRAFLTQDLADIVAYDDAWRSLAGLVGTELTR